ncbi:MAG: ABC transporter permease subunit [Edaphobacter sp.]
MIWYKIWRESQARFLIGAAVLGGMCVAYVLFEPKLFSELARERPFVTSYLNYIYWKIYAGPTRGMMQLACLLLGLGGLQRDRKQQTIGFTLALPISRTRLIATRAGVGVFQVAVLSLLPALLIFAASPVVHQHFPLEWALPFVGLWMAGGLATFALSFVCSVIFASEYTSLAVSYVVYFFYLAATRLPSLAPYPLHIGDIMSGRVHALMDLKTAMWTGDFPVAIFSGFIAASMLMFFVANLITRRQDV